ncbi:Rhs family protein OS=Vibrio vulnificus (strain CMCP6) GN=VV2_0425 PE=4 SV=1 [Tuwongella immobilis]|uniref:Rhs family protein n=2 Tax=Tuwongella immobilis TaxID=692036 RepID=A0A6C2YH09_9BACT|nr:Rhs family protein OS=Vibrio vulnificus (strain CMCP6) GN=VV2_0425 PE=4 SV=1 [Tuwongella immobilis]VTR97038.1 Rhs family protein OS=Vibrio vulnificus (strain CMCP6) GN=VV2_0425 PE=4 SV=1 [Tuwongella immobilis]
MNPYSSGSGSFPQLMSDLGEAKDSIVKWSFQVGDDTLLIIRGFLQDPLTILTQGAFGLRVGFKNVFIDPYIHSYQLGRDVIGMLRDPSYEPINPHIIRYRNDEIGIFWVTAYLSLDIITVLSLRNPFRKSASAQAPTPTLPGGNLGRYGNSGRLGKTGMIDDVPTPGKPPAAAPASRATPGMIDDVPTPGKPPTVAPAAPAVRRLQLKTVDEQAKFLAENVPGLTQEQAKLLLTEAQSRNSSVVIGGSRVRGNHGPTSDLDVGYGSLSSQQAKKVNEKVSKLGPLKLEETRIVPGYESEAIPKITTPEEFFQRSGVRSMQDINKPGQPYGPSGSITVTPQGEVIIIPPGATPP